MAPKVSKKTVSETKPVSDVTESSIEAIKLEWLNIVKEITSTTDKLSGLEKKRDELVSKLWEIMNKNPSEHIVEEESKPEEKKASIKGAKKTVKNKSEIIDDSETADSIKPVAKKIDKTKLKPSAKEVKPVDDSDNEEEKPKPKAKVEKPKVTKTTKSETKTETKTEAKPTSAKKISAPVKGTPKPKIDEDSDDGKARPMMNDSSSESDVDSLSSVSSESEASGNDE